MSGWRNATHRERCPICDKPDWCSVSDDGAACVCMRVEGDRQVKNGGWLHRLKDRPDASVLCRLKRIDRRPPMVDIPRAYAALRRRWEWRLADGVAMSLGVSPESVERLSPGYCDFDRAVAYPMRSGFGTVIGIRFRDNEGNKWSVKGSRNGLFFDTATERAEKAVIVEGPTDTIAALTLGLCAIGRPSCKGCHDHVATLLMRWRTRIVTIIADNDPYRETENSGRVFNPGLDGAKALADSIRIQSRIVVLPAKDIRAWVAGGATRDAFDTLEKNSKSHH